MAKVAGPLMSMDASGKLAGAIVFSKWKGRPYVRALVTPANPKAPKQVGVRAMFKFLAQNWKLSVDASEKATWTKRAAQEIISPFNAYMSANQKRWRSFDGPSKGYPATEDDLHPTAYVGAAVGGVRLATVTVTYDAIRGGWGGLIFRSLTTPFTASFANCVAAVLLEADLSTSYIDTPLVAGTYHYQVGNVTENGKLDVVTTDLEAVVT